MDYWRLSIRELSFADTAELATISDVPEVIEWMTFMENAPPRILLKGATAEAGQL